jgi:hypothetical protein
VSAGAGVFDVDVGDGEEVLGDEADHAFGHAGGCTGGKRRRTNDQ